MFGGLHAFPLTPMPDDVLDEPALTGLIDRLAAAGVDAITVLGSTGSYAYLTAAERARVVELAIARAGDVPVIAGVGALRTSQVLRHLADAEAAGASGVLLAPMAYQPLTDAEILGLYREVAAATDLPVMVYDNPTTTHVEFSVELYGEIAALPGIAAIKIPPVPLDPESARRRVAAVRAVVPEHVQVGISGDHAALAGLQAGCEIWCSVIGGTLPDPALAITRAAQGGRWAEARAAAERLAPVWELFAACGGSLRGTVALAEQLSLVPPGSLPAPLQGPDVVARRRAAAVVDACGLGEARSR